METSATYRYLAPATRVHAGVDVLHQVAREAERVGAKRVFVICSESVAQSSDLLDRVRGVLGDRMRAHIPRQSGSRRWRWWKRALKQRGMPGQM